MGRKIAADAAETWRVALVFVNPDENGVSETFTEYEGVYNSVGAAKGRVTYWRNWTKFKVENEINSGKFLIDGWVEKAALEWERVTPE